jgi:hypothetical protein
VHKFFDAIESAASIGNWSSEDMMRIATLKLTDKARTFYNASRLGYHVVLLQEPFPQTVQGR